MNISPTLTLGRTRPARSPALLAASLYLLSAWTSLRNTCASRSTKTLAVSIFVMALLCVFPESAFAQSSTTGFETGMCKLISSLLSWAKYIVVICIAVVGLLMLADEIKGYVMIAIRIAAGCAILFSAPTIAGWISGSAIDASSISSSCGFKAGA